MTRTQRGGWRVLYPGKVRDKPITATVTQAVLDAIQAGTAQVDPRLGTSLSKSEFIEECIRKACRLPVAK